MALVVTEDGLVEESEMELRLFKEGTPEDASWAIVHECWRDGRLVRRDVWVNFKGSGLPAAGSQQGGM